MEYRWSSLSAEDLIRILHLRPLPREGGFYRETYRSSRRLPSKRNLATAIYYLLTPATCSAMHRLPADEIYHFYLGDCVELLLLHPDLSSEVVRLGSDFRRGQQFQYLVPAGTWQGARLVEGGRWALLGTTMAPGFDWSDYEQGSRDYLIHLYPESKDLIEQLTPQS